MAKKLKSGYKGFIFCYLFCLTFFCVISGVKADKAYYMNGTSKFKTEPNEGGSYPIASAKYLTAGDKIIIIENRSPIKSTNNACSSSYYYVEYMAHYGYVCGDAIQFTVSNEYDELWRTSGFPESYWPSLTTLKKAHPNWTFKAVTPKTSTSNSAPQTKFWDAVKEESYVGRSLISTKNQGWLSTAGGSYDYYTDTFKILDAGFYAANDQTVSYYLDPRNFINDPHIYMFLALNYSDSYTLEGVQSILNGSCMAGSYTDKEGTKTYAETFLAAAKEKGVSPYLLVTRAKQEINGNPTCSQSATGTVAGYEGYYNFFNIGAWEHSGNTPIINGLIYAKNKGWDTVYKSIAGGAQLLANGYIAQGQNNLYFQKWDVKTGKYSNQYMTNIDAPRAEAEIISSSYKTITSELIFEIPVYAEMPEYTKLPNVGNPNNYLSSITIDGKPIDGFDIEKINYNVSLSVGTSSVTIGANPINGKATITGLGKVNLTNKEQTILVKVTAENGSPREYRFHLPAANAVAISIDEVISSLGYRNDGTYFSGIGLGTNLDSITSKINQINGFVKVTYKDANGTVISNRSITTGQYVIIESDGKTGTYQIVVAGDPTGDGNIDIADLLRVQKIILGAVSPAEVYLKGADANRDGKVDIADLLSIQKHILNVKQIQQ